MSYYYYYYYYDLLSHQVKTALNVVFDEAMADSDAPLPNAHHLCGKICSPY